MEPGKSAFRRMIRNASLLGLASLILNLFYQKLSPRAPLPLGNLFLFVSANIYGIIGGTISAVISEVPRLILNAGDKLLIVKNISLVGALGFVSSEFPSIPNAIPFSIFWVASMYLIGSVNHALGAPLMTLLFIYDLMLLALSKMLLMSTTLCSWLTSKLRHLTFQLLLPECLFIAFVLCCGSLVVLPFNRSYGYEFLASAAGPFSLLFIAVASLVPIALGWLLTRIILLEYGPEFQTALRASPQKSKFSAILGSAFKSKQPASSAAQIQEESPLAHFEQPEEDHSGQLIVSKEGSIVFLNSLFRVLSGLASEEGLGAQIAKVSMHPQIHAAIVSLLQETPAKGPRVREVRIEDPSSGNSQFLELVHTFSLNRESKEDDRHHFSLKDITDRRTVESHLLQAKKVESLGSMVSGIAHSFNDALTAITGQASLAKMSRDAETTEKALDQILDASKQAGTLVQQLLDFALDTSHLRRPEDLIELINSRAELIQRSAGDSFELVIEKHADILPVECNSNLLLQAITNLILNAKESYEKGTGKILLDVDKEEIPPELSHIQPSVRPGTFARIRVRDFGSGMPPEILAKAFDPLFSTKHGVGHTGLGLSIVFAVIRAHDGFLTAESHVGNGTTISLYLPIVEKSTSERLRQRNVEKKSPSMPATLNGKTILIVEDDPSVLAILELLFSTMSCTIHPFNSGMDALKKLPDLSFDVFLVDLVLPSMSGIELAKKIRTQKGDSCPGVIMSGYAIDPKVQELNLQILRKPFDIAELEKAVLASLAQES